jgi:hypothetical protein
MNARYMDFPKVTNNVVARTEEILAKFIKNRYGLNLYLKEVYNLDIKFQPIGHKFTVHFADGNMTSKPYNPEQILQELVEKVSANRALGKDYVVLDPLDREIIHTNVKLQDLCTQEVKLVKRAAFTNSASNSPDPMIRHIKQLDKQDKQDKDKLDKDKPEKQDKDKPDKPDKPDTPQRSEIARDKYKKRGKSKSSLGIKAKMVTKRLPTAMSPSPISTRPLKTTSVQQGDYYDDIDIPEEHNGNIQDSHQSNDINHEMEGFLKELEHKLEHNLSKSRSDKSSNNVENSLSKSRSEKTNNSETTGRKSRHSDHKSEHTLEKTKSGNFNIKEIENGIEKSRLEKKLSNNSTLEELPEIDSKISLPLKLTETSTPEKNLSRKFASHNRPARAGPSRKAHLNKSQERNRRDISHRRSLSQGALSVMMYSGTGTDPLVKTKQL